MTHLTQEGVVADIKKRTPAAGQWVDGTDFGFF